MRNVSLLTRQIFYVHTFFISLTVGLMGALSVFLSDALLQPSPLAKGVLSGLTLFWGIRLAFQFFVYDKTLWHSKRFETRVHWLFALLWLYLTATYGSALFRQF
jgi:hypothetical protein